MADNQENETAVDLAALEVAQKVVDKGKDDFAPNLKPAGDDGFKIAPSTDADWANAIVGTRADPVSSESAASFIQEPHKEAEFSPRSSFRADAGIPQKHPKYGDAPLMEVWDPETNTFIDRPVGYATVPLPQEGDQPLEERQDTLKQQTAMGLMEQNIRRGLEIDRAEADYEYDQTQKLMERNEQIDVENADKIQADQERVEASYVDFERANKDLVDLKIDKDQYWNSRSTGQKMAGALSLMLSAYTRGRDGVGGKNPMIAMYEKAVNDDIRIQIAEHADKKSGVARKKNLISFYRDRLANDQQAVAAVKLKANQEAQMKVMTFKAKNKGTRAEINADKMIIDLKVSQARYEAEFARASQVQDYKAKKEFRQNRALNTNILQGGNNLQADTPEQARVAKQLVAKQKTAKSAVGDVNSYLNEYDVIDWANPSADLKAKMNAAQTSLQAAFRIMLVGPGTISEADREIIARAVPELGGAFGSVSGKDVKRYNALLERFMIQSDHEIEGLVPGYQPANKYQDLQKGAVKFGGK